VNIELPLNQAHVELYTQFLIPAVLGLVDRKRIFLVYDDRRDSLVTQTEGREDYNQGKNLIICWIPSISFI
jgi:hypothetical protein